ncbi:tRNA-specific adenosine deaminase [PVC group bacterium (ex Bugula neritina AB1)]|nr:tRNA-specific adenosine deaminase [PVC group bacterium (ex Bugula neritina AB1)]
MLDPSYFMKLAIQEAEKAFEKKEIPVGCVIVHQGKIIAKSHNQVEQLKDPTAHAEMIAITQASAYLNSWRLTDCTLFSTLEPCPMCAGGIHLARIPTVFFGAFDPKKGACGSICDILRNDKLNHQVQVYPSLFEKECSNLLTSFFQKLRQSNL